MEEQEKSLGQRALAKAAKPLLAVLDDFARAQMAANSDGQLGIGFRDIMENQMDKQMENETVTTI